MDLPVTFLIPVVSKARAADWALVEANLQATVQSILGSSDPNFLVLIAYDDRPVGSYWGDDRVISIEMPTLPFPGRPKLDKARKIKTAAAWLRSRFPDMYAMFLDADDLVRKDLVHEVRSLREEVDGYSITHGYRFDAQSHCIRPVFGNFHTHCGSSFVCRFIAEELPTSHDDRTSPFSQVCDARHADHHKAAEAVGKKISPLAQFAVVYKVHHPNSVAQALENRPRSVERRSLGYAAVGRYILASAFNGPICDRGPAVILRYGLFSALTALYKSVPVPGVRRFI